MFYSALSDKLYREWRKKAFFLQSFNLPKCIVVGLLTVEEPCNLLFKWEWPVNQNQYAGQKTFNMFFLVAASLLLLEFSCFRNIVWPYHLRMLLRVYTRNCLLSEIVSLVFCSTLKKSTLLNKLTGAAAHCSLFKANKILARSKFSSWEWG